MTILPGSQIADATHSGYVPDELPGESLFIAAGKSRKDVWDETVSRNTGNPWGLCQECAQQIQRHQKREQDDANASATPTVGGSSSVAGTTAQDYDVYAGAARIMNSLSALARADARFHAERARDQSRGSSTESQKKAEQEVVPTTQEARVQPAAARPQRWQESSLRLVVVDAARYLGRAALLVYLVMTPLFMIGFGEGSITRQMLFSWPAGVIVFGSLIGATVFVATRPVRSDPQAGDAPATGKPPFANATDRNSEEQ